MTEASGLHAQALEVPFLAGHVNDTAHLLSPQAIEALEAVLQAHEDSTSNQVVVLTVPGLQGEVLEEYAMRVAETWKIGRAEKDNGVLLLIARDDRAIRIEVGSGLEGNLPDITCGRIIRNEIVPRFRDGDFDGGVTAGVNAILAAIQGAYVADDTAANPKVDWQAGVIMLLVFTLVIGTFTVLSVVAEGFSGWFLYFFLIPFWLAFPLAIFGSPGGLVLLFAYLVGIGGLKLWLAHSQAGKKIFKKWSQKWVVAGGGSSGWRFSGSGGRSSGGGFSGGRGGFSGGGGSFSGGGASGRW
ncbi:MAG: TPM domain-containing protein [candidate division KSB1 bacterium]|nr:TPM domain-containing protein [candidate division KSB1 bacterium]MDZ7273254.1 TPM domain-containing protein [candidate division KSB1 bacterium]MDZ7285356.1 TPM domain-containing protein [candidate division KSB1 bacterium]MDZ7298388.1 TPM domain-containing protein [candidate division KSB1 bacterium]MDZ7306466.1 TPM domain-containing protein [candidate division KSB1 bacterium]